MDVLTYAEHTVGSGLDGAAVCYAQCRVDGAVGWGIGWDTFVLAASVRAVLSAANRAAAG